MTEFATCTVITKNYIAFARTLVESVQAHHPGSRSFVLVVDDYTGYIDPTTEPFTVVSLADLALSEHDAMVFWYTPALLCMALKPYLMAYVATTTDIPKVIHLDADTLVLNPLDRLLDALDDHNAFLIPQISQPTPTALGQELMNAGSVGVYNTGVFGVRNGAEGRRLLAWWQERTTRHASRDVQDGTFTDQLWANLMPAFFEDVAIVRSSAHNLLPDLTPFMPITEREGQVFVADEPLTVLHFISLKNTDDPNDDLFPGIREWRTRLPAGVITAARGYIEALVRNGLVESRYWPYSHGQYADGEPIHPTARSLWRRLAERPDPHSSAFRAWLNAPAEGTSRRWPRITRWAAELYQQDAELQARWPHIDGVHRVQFIDWLLRRRDKLKLTEGMTRMWQPGLIRLVAALQRRLRRE